MLRLKTTQRNKQLTYFEDVFGKCEANSELFRLLNM